MRPLDKFTPGLFDNPGLVSPPDVDWSDLNIGGAIDPGTIDPGAINPGAINPGAGDPGAALLAATTPDARRGSPGSGVTPVVTPPVTLPTEPASPTPFTIAISWDSSVALAPAGFTSDVLAAVNFLETQFTDPVTINVDVGYEEVAGNALGRGDLGESLSNMASVSYADLIDAVAASATTATDASVVASLPAANPISGSNDWVTTAQAKALGLPASELSNSDGSTVDGSIGFGASTDFTYGDTNAGGTVAAGTYDFFATVVHELTEVMGRQLLVGSAEEGLSNSYTLLDLLHWSAPGTRDLSQFTPGYFSPDGGTTDLGAFNTIAGGDAGDWASSVVDDPFDALRDLRRHGDRFGQRSDRDGRDRLEAGGFERHNHANHANHAGPYAGIPANQACRGPGLHVAVFPAVLAVLTVFAVYAGHADPTDRRAGVPRRPVSRSRRKRHIWPTPRMASVCRAAPGCRETVRW